MLGFLFPGQGSQFVGMAKFLYDSFEEAKDLFSEASDAISVDMKKLCFEGPESDLKLTEFTQPALVLASTCYHACLKKELEFSPNASAGHSLGEYSALVAAGSLKFTDAIKAVHFRGKAMQNAVPVGEGAMLAILGVEDSIVRDICKWATAESGHGPLEPANYNTPGQVVVSGSAKTAQWLTENFQAELFENKIKRLKAIPLNVSAPFHCSLMMPAQEKMSEYLSEVPFSDAQHLIIQNFTALPELKADLLRKNLVSQVSSPVRWVESIEVMKKQNIKTLIEMGPGRVLTGLVKKIDSDSFQTFNMENLEDFKNLVNVLKEFKSV